MPISPEIHGMRRKTELYTGMKKNQTNTNPTNKQVVL